MAALHITNLNAEVEVADLIRSWKTEAKNVKAEEAEANSEA